MKTLSKTAICFLIGGIGIGMIYSQSRPNLEREVAQDGQTPEKVADIPQNAPLSEYGFEDLLDAIEQVESYGDPEAIGDPIERPDLVGDYDKKAAAEYEGVHILGYQHRYFPDNENPIEYIVKDGKVYAKEYQAVGAFQIHKIYVDDVNRILRKNKYTYNDRWDKIKSKTMVCIYLRYYYQQVKLSDALNEIIDGNLNPYEIAVRIHNGGPNGWKKESTKPYWEKVKRELEGR